MVPVILNSHPAENSRILVLEAALEVWHNTTMKSTSFPRPTEQRKVEKLLVKLAKMQPCRVKFGKIRTENLGLNARIKNFESGLAAEST